MGRRSKAPAERSGTQQTLDTFYRRQAQPITEDAQQQASQPIAMQGAPPGATSEQQTERPPRPPTLQGALVHGSLLLLPVWSRPGFDPVRNSQSAQSNFQLCFARVSCMICDSYLPTKMRAVPVCLMVLGKIQE